MNANFGATNFDNIFYSILMVFVCVTLEGWSDIQRMIQQGMTNVMFLYFVPLVFIGAFFLLNLTMAVINSKFTEAHKDQ
jgi:Ion transport protein